MILLYVLFRFYFRLIFRIETGSETYSFMESRSVLSFAIGFFLRLPRRFSLWKIVLVSLPRPKEKFGVDLDPYGVRGRPVSLSIDFLDFNLVHVSY